ncbi:AAA family ATPase [Microbacterium sp. Mu-80]|uniref:AAA family ATPase n=1 Tax=Microbacterium bandirmense TaxID=3122050 RepID=A0ABU8L7E9_9MICO
MARTNDSPFRAGFGKTPPMLAGRDSILDDFSASLAEGTWSTERTMLIEGLRGVGKTVLLNALEDAARERGWLVVSETATPGFLDRITHGHLQRAIDQLDPPATRRLTGGGTAGVSITTETVSPRQYPTTLRDQLTTLANLLTPRGILITLDEINGATIDELADFAAEHQHAIRNDQEIAFVGAGLRNAIRDALSHRSLTFLRRSLRPPIDFLDYDDATDALRIPILDRGRTIGDAALDYAVRATQGYPFLAQLIGDLAWKQSPDQTEISLDDVKHAYRRARRTMGSNIHEPSLSDLSHTDRTVLAHMAADDGPTAVSDVREALGVTAQYLNVYRQRLIDAGMIVPAGRGMVDIAMPYLREYLRDHIVSDATVNRAMSRTSFPPPPALDEESSA